MIVSKAGFTQKMLIHVLRNKAGQPACLEELTVRVNTYLDWMGFKYMSEKKMEAALRSNDRFEEVVPHLWHLKSP
jgi:hypothetical protein